MKTAGSLLPASILGLAVFTPVLLPAAVVYSFDDNGANPPPQMASTPWVGEGRPLSPQEEEPLLADLTRRISLTTLPSSDPDCFLLTPDGAPRETADVRLIREVDRRVSELSVSSLQALLDLVIISGEPGRPAPLDTAAPDSPVTQPIPSISSALATSAATLKADPLWEKVPPVAGSNPGEAAVRADLRRQTGMYLLRTMALRDPAAAQTQFTALAPSLALACVKAAPEIDSLEPLAYLSASGDVLAFARSLAVRDPGTGIKWYLGHRSMELSDIDTGLSDLVGDIARKDLIAAFALASRLPAKELDSAAEGIAATATTSSSRVLLVEALRQPRATAVQASVLRSIGHQNATTYLMSPAWIKQEGFTPDEQRLLQEGSELRRLGDPTFRFSAGATGLNVPR